MTMDQGIKNKQSQRSRNIAVLVEIDDSWGRKVVEAISRFAREASWRILLVPKDAERRMRVPENWNGDGVIASLRDLSMVDHVKRLNVPVVNVGSMFDEEMWCGCIATDDQGRATMAFDHFRDRQLQHFACYSPTIGSYPDERVEKFRELVTAAGFSCSHFPLRENSETRSPNAFHELEAVSGWLVSLPKPIGIFASDAYSARQLVDVCWEKEFDVPGDYAILSGDEDELLCKSIAPPISSIELASHGIGHEACQMLEQMIRTKRVPKCAKLLQPLRVCARWSTDLVAIDDPTLAAVVKLIWDRAADGIQVKDLVRFAAMSRRTLEQRFRESLGRTPAEEIRRVRLERARQLIVTTSRSVSSIALATGFSSGPYLTHAFRRHFGITPSVLRVGRRANDDSTVK